MKITLAILASIGIMGGIIADWLRMQKEIKKFKNND